MGLSDSQRRMLCAEHIAANDFSLNHQPDSEELIELFDAMGVTTEQLEAHVGENLKRMGVPANENVEAEHVPA